MTGLGPRGPVQGPQHPGRGQSDEEAPPPPGLVGFAPKDVIWGETCIRSEAFLVSLVRKGCALAMYGDAPGEWESWVSASSPNARPVWNSHFVALLHKCLWYALSLHDTRLNLRSFMWGVGIKGYPTKWWFPTLQRIHSRYFTSVLTLRQLISWRKEGCLFSSGT